MKKDISFQDRFKEIRRILKNRFGEDKVIVQPGTVSDFNIKVVTDEFLGMPFNERREMIFNLMEKNILENEDTFFELFTDDENEMFGIDLKDFEPENLPFWSESIARHYNENKVKSVNKYIDEIELPFITTFYSIKGGVGRTTAMAYTAHLLADKGFTVVALDFDLEAPGLPSILGVEDEIREKRGILEYLNQVESEEERNLKSHLIKVDPKKELYLFPAGKPGKRFVQLLDNLNIKQYYRFNANPLQILFDEIKMEINPHVILVDARTGMTTANAPLLFEVSDMAVIFFYPNNQTRILLEILINGIMAGKTRRTVTGKKGEMIKGFTPETRFVLSPVPASDIKDQQIEIKGKEFLEDLFVKPYSEQVKMEIPIFNFDDFYLPVNYDEKVVYSDVYNEKLEDTYKDIVPWIENYLIRDTSIHFDKQAKDELLESIEIEAVKAEYIKNDINEVFVKPDDFNKLTDPKTVLVRGGVGSGKTMLFRYYYHNWKELGKSCAVAYSPEMKAVRTLLNQEGFRIISKLIDDGQKSWEIFWLLLIYKTLENQKILGHNKAKNIKYNQEDFIKDFKENFDLFEIENKIIQKDRGIKKPLTLLFDGLDSLFGDCENSLLVREKALRGLFNIIKGLDGKLYKLFFKVFLRQDLWDLLKYEDKNFFFRKESVISWDRDNYIKVLLKQLFLFDKFKMFIKKELMMEPSFPEEIATEHIKSIVEILCGKYIRGIKPSSTLDWIMDKTGDGNDDHSPLNLLILFREAIKLEQESKKKNYNSLLSSDTMQKALKTTSKIAWKNIRKEYNKELKTFFNLVDESKIPVNTVGIKMSEIILTLEEIDIAESSGIIEKVMKKNGIFLPALYYVGIAAPNK